MARGISGARLRTGLCAAALVASIVPAAEAATRETVLHRFLNKANGFIPGGYGFDGSGLASDAAGALYGTTYSQGPKRSGTVFRLTPPAAGQNAWTLETLFGFQGGADGGGPEGNLAIDSSGAVYGTTSVGGTESAGQKSGWGTVFKLSPPSTSGGAWTESVLHAFTLNQDGAYPGGVIRGRQGALYVAAYSGGPAGFGTILKLTPPAKGQSAWSTKVLYAFKGKADGSAPLGSLVMDEAGALYGATADTGSDASPQAGRGSVFKLTPPAIGRTNWTFTTLHSFTGGTDGASPNSLVIGPQGAVYGTTSDVVRLEFYGSGTVFELRPPAKGQTGWRKTTLYSFSGQADGASGSGLVLSGTGSLFGTTYLGGANIFGYGTVFRLDPPVTAGKSWAIRTLYAFKGSTDGALPVGRLLIDQSGSLYGATASGGGNSCRFEFKGGYSVSGCGTVYRLTP